MTAAGQGCVKTRLLLSLWRTSFVDRPISTRFASSRVQASRWTMPANTHAWQKALKRAGIENFRWPDSGHTWAIWHRH
jgi:hypothetical protein